MRFQTPFLLETSNWKAKGKKRGGYIYLLIMELGPALTKSAPILCANGGTQTVACRQMETRIVQKWRNIYGNWIWPPDERGSPT